MKTIVHPWLALVLAALINLYPAAQATAAPSPFLGNWALTIPGGGAGWLGLEEADGKLQGRILWGGGSVLPVDGVQIDGNKLVVTRIHESRTKGPDGQTVRKRETETITARVSGDEMSLTTVRGDGGGRAGQSFTGRRIPALPSAPDLLKVKYGPPVPLFDGTSLDGWQLTGPNLANGWSVQDGVLVNRPVQEEGKPHKSYGNLRTAGEFEDFNLTLETRVSPKGNSGIYLRGIYEVQVADSYGQSPNSHGMGGIYSRITPTANAAKPTGQWQSFDITLVDRHVTVVLNGQKIIDNQPLPGCTGGALWSDQFRPGPIYLQGDHTGIEYRNIVIRPVVKG